MADDEKERGVIDSAIREGISTLLKRHPKFREQEGYLMRHLDLRSVRRNVEAIREDIERKERAEDKELSEEEKVKIIYHGLFESAASGRLFDNIGKETILRQSLEERTVRDSALGDARGISRNERYLDAAIASFRDIYALLKRGDYAGHMPEFAEAVSTVYNMGFLDSSVDLLRHYGLIDRNRYKILKQSIHRKTSEGVSEAEKAIKKYSALKKSAAVVLGVSGFSAIIVSGSRFTGSAVGQGSSGILWAVIGLASFVVAVLLFLSSSRNKRY